MRSVRALLSVSGVPRRVKHYAERSRHVYGGHRSPLAWSGWLSLAPGVVRAWGYEIGEYLCCGGVKAHDIQRAGILWVADRELVGRHGNYYYFGGDTGLFEVLRYGVLTKGFCEHSELTREAWASLDIR